MTTTPVAGTHFRGRVHVMSTTSFSTPDKILGAAALASRDIATISSATWSKALIDDTLGVKCRSRARQRRAPERADEVANHGSERIGAPYSVCASVLRSTDRQCHHRVDEAIILTLFRSPEISARGRRIYWRDATARKER